MDGNRHRRNAVVGVRGRIGRGVVACRVSALVP
jgi:hypothetical protein